MSPLFIEHIPDLSGLLLRPCTSCHQVPTHGSSVNQRDRKRDHDHACKSKIDIHEVSIQNMIDGAILNRSQENKKFGVMI
jgi:hypothetical protein